MAAAGRWVDLCKVCFTGIHEELVGEDVDLQNILQAAGMAPTRCWTFGAPWDRRTRALVMWDTVREARCFLAYVNGNKRPRIAPGLFGPINFAFSEARVSDFLEMCLHPVCVS